MDFRIRRQFTVFLLFAAVIFLIGVSIFQTFRPKPTCTDGKLNQNETEVDCGGSCISCALRNQKDIEVYWRRFIKVRENSYDVAAEVHNPNVRLAAISLVYEFKLYDTAGVLITSQLGKTFLYPGETAHIIEVGLASGRTIQTITLTLSDIQWKLADVIAPDIIAGGRKECTGDTDTDGRQSCIEAEIANRTLRDFENIDVNALVLNEEGNVIGVNRTLIDALGAGQVQNVKFLWPMVLPGKVVSLIVEPRSKGALPKE